MRKLTILFAVLAILILVAGCAPLDRPADKDTTDNHEDMEEQDTEQMEDTNMTEDVEEPEMMDEPEAMDEPEETELKDDHSDLPLKEVTEGDLVSFPNLKATDPDGDPVTYTFTKPLNAEGEWLTEVGDAGDYVVTVTASDGANVVSQDVLIRVHAKNKPPVIEIEGTLEFDEGDLVELLPDITDPDGDNFTVTYSGWMDSDTKETGFDDAGDYKVVITADDGMASSKQEVLVVINNLNREPELNSLDDIEIVEGDSVAATASATDPDGDDVTITFSTPLNADGNWQTVIGDEGTYDVTVTASDGDLETQTSFTLTVLPANKAPIIELDSPVEATEGEMVELDPVVTDPEGDEVTLRYSGWMTSSTKQLGYDDQGNHKVTITAEDTAGNMAKLEVIVAVADVNRPPSFGAGSFE